MRLVVAPDSFKEGLTSSEAAAAMARGVKQADPQAEVMEVPLADGGEGTVEALVRATEGSFHFADVTGPLGGKVQARFGLLGDRVTAVIEMAAASGFQLVPENLRNPLRTTTYGTGELIRAALDLAGEGFPPLRRLLIGLGDSATVDGGAGMAQALGADLLDGEGHPIGRGGGELLELKRLRLDRLDPRLEPVQIDGICDVTNPLSGDHGAARVFGPQKGADHHAVRLLEEALDHLTFVIQQSLGKDVRDTPGTGSAGGLGAGLIAFLGVRLRRGAPWILKQIGFRRKLSGADLVLTGEGRLDGSSASGKVVASVGEAAREAHVPAIALVGSIGEGAEDILEHGIRSYCAIAPADRPPEESIQRAAELLTSAAAATVRAFAAERKEERPPRHPGAKG